MSRLKEHYWEEIIKEEDNEYELMTALHYQTTVWNIVALIQQYGMQQVFMDVFAHLEKKEIDRV